MTATDELRAMLDERGVEWDKGAFPNEARTYWRDTVARPWNEQRLYVTALLTPEQAIAATLGSWTCHRITHGLERDREIATVSWTCSECGEHIGETHRFCPNCGRKVVER